MKIWRLIFAIWLFLWVFFLVRGLYKGEFKEYRALLQRAPSARRAYIIGEDLYKFLEFCLKGLPKDSTYRMTGALKPIDRQRLIYYLYPHKESYTPEYILCYKINVDFSLRDFYRLATLKSDQFILKKKKGD